MPVLTILFALAVAFASPTTQTSLGDSKIFVIGLSKTGTTSLGDAFEKLGLRRSGWKDIHSRYLFHMFAANRSDTLISYARNYDVLEDLPWALAYKELAIAFPEARFILTMRLDESVWLTSVEKHTQRREWIGNKKIFGCKKVGREKCEDKYLDAYRRHNEDVRDFFAEEGKGRLLEMIIDAPTELKPVELQHENIVLVDTKWLCLITSLHLEQFVERLGGWDQLGPFPRSNISTPSSTLQALWIKAVNKCEKATLKILKWTVRLLKGFSFLAVQGL